MTASDSKRSVAARLACPLRIETTADDATFLLVLHGECDLVSADLIEETFDQAASSNCAGIIVDLEFCTFFDSTGISALLKLHRRIARLPERDLLILPGPPAVQRVFEICDLLDVLPFRGD